MYMLLITLFLDCNFTDLKMNTINEADTTNTDIYKSYKKHVREGLILMLEIVY